MRNRTGGGGTEIVRKERDRKIKIDETTTKDQLSRATRVDYGDLRGKLRLRPRVLRVQEPLATAYVGDPLAQIVQYRV